MGYTKQQRARLSLYAYCCLTVHAKRMVCIIIWKEKNLFFFFYSTKLDRFTIHKLSIVLAISGRHLNTNPLLCSPPPVHHCVEPVLILLNSLVAAVKREAENKNLRLSRNGDITIIKIIITITIIIFCQWIYERFFFMVTIFWFYVRLNKYSYFNSYWFMSLLFGFRQLGRHPQILYQSYTRLPRRLIYHTFLRSCY